LRGNTGGPAIGMVEALYADSAERPPPGRIIDGHMKVFIADAAGAAMAGMLTSDAVAHAIDPAQALDIDVDHLARASLLIADHRRPGLQAIQPVQAQPPQDQPHS
jgi:hypothetical protein